MLGTRIEFKGATLEESPGWHRSEYIIAPLNMGRLAWLGITPSSAVGKDTESYRLEWEYDTKNNYIFALYNHNQGDIGNAGPWYANIILLGII